MYTLHTHVFARLPSIFMLSRCLLTESVVGRARKAGDDPHVGAFASDSAFFSFSIVEAGNIMDKVLLLESTRALTNFPVPPKRAITFALFFFSRSFWGSSFLFQKKKKRNKNHNFLLLPFWKTAAKKIFKHFAAFSSSC